MSMPGWPSTIRLLNFERPPHATQVVGLLVMEPALFDLERMGGHSVGGVAAAAATALALHGLHVAHISRCAAVPLWGGERTELTAPAVSSTTHVTGRGVCH